MDNLRKALDLMKDHMNLKGMAEDSFPRFPRSKEMNDRERAVEIVDLNRDEPSKGTIVTVAYEGIVDAIEQALKEVREEASEYDDYVRNQECLMAFRKGKEKALEEAARVVETCYVVDFNHDCQNLEHENARKDFRKQFAEEIRRLIHE